MRSSRHSNCRAITSKEVALSHAIVRYHLVGQRYQIGEDFEVGRLRGGGERRSNLERRSGVVVRTYFPALADCPASPQMFWLTPVPVKSSCALEFSCLYLISTSLHTRAEVSRLPPQWKFAGPSVLARAVIDRRLRIRAEGTRIPVLIVSLQPVRCHAVLDPIHQCGEEVVGLRSDAAPQCPVFGARKSR